MEEYVMNRSLHLLFLFFIISFVTPNTSLLMAASPTNEKTGTITNNDDDLWADDFDYDEDDQGEEGLNLTAWQRFKNKLSEAQTKIKLGYRTKAKPWIKKHRKEIIAGSAATATAVVVIAYFMMASGKA